MNEWPFVRSALRTVPDQRNRCRKDLKILVVKIGEGVDFYSFGFFGK